MTNNKQQTEINAVEYLSKVNQFAKENNTDKPKQQTAVEWLVEQLHRKYGGTDFFGLIWMKLNKPKKWIRNRNLICLIVVDNIK